MKGPVQQVAGTNMKPKQQVETSLVYPIKEAKLKPGEYLTGRAMKPIPPKKDGDLSASPRDQLHLESDPAANHIDWTPSSAPWNAGRRRISPELLKDPVVGQGTPESITMMPIIFLGTHINARLVKGQASAGFLFPVHRSGDDLTIDPEFTPRGKQF